MKQSTKQVETTKEFKLEQAFALWKNISKAGNEYLKGKDLNGNKVLGYFNTNKKNPKEPDVRVYTVDKDGKTDKEIASLWDYTSKSGRQYLSGATDEKEKIVAWYGKTEKAPYITAYFRTEDNDLPFN